MTGTQLSDMTISATIPAGGYVPFVVTSAEPGFSLTSNYIYDLGADLLTRVSYTALALPTAAALVGSTGPSNVQADINARPTTAALAAPTGGDLIGLFEGTVGDAIKYITAEMAGIPDDGDEMDDVTTELQALADTAAALGLPVILGNRTYRVNATGVTFYTSVTGMEDTLIQSTSTEQDNVSVITMGGPGAIDTLTIDGNVSADPSPWNSGNYDTFTGAQGLTIGTVATPVSGVVVKNVRVQNVRWGAFRVELGSSKVTYINCTADRCRDINGDGFIAIGASQVSYENCYAYDFTRIGFVSDTYGDAPGTFCDQITYTGCRAEYGHDAAILYGGGEYNSGFWSEKSANVSWMNCAALDTNQRGFVGASGEAANNQTWMEFTADTCIVDDVETGFLFQGLSSIPVRGVLTNCDATNVTVTAFLAADGTARDIMSLKNCGSTLVGANTARSSVKAANGTVLIDGFTEVWEDINTTLRDSGTDYYASLGHLSNAVGTVTVGKWRSYDSAGAGIYSVFKFLTEAAATMRLTIDDCRLRGVGLAGVSLVTKDVAWQRLGSIDFPNVVIEGGSDLETDSVFSIPLRLTTELVLFKNVRFDFTASAKWVALFNVSNTNPWAKVKFEGCTAIKNFETGGNAVVLTIAGGDAGTLAGTTGANDIWAVDCNHINTGGATATPIYHIDSLTDAGGKLYGTGNMKSSTITNAVNGAGKLSAAASFDPWGT